MFFCFGMNSILGVLEFRTRLQVPIDIGSSTKNRLSAGDSSTFVRSSTPYMEGRFLSEEDTVRPLIHDTACSCYVRHSILLLRITLSTLIDS